MGEDFVESPERLTQVFPRLLGRVLAPEQGRERFTTMLPGAKQDEIAEELPVLGGQSGQNLRLVDEDRWSS